jgi:hypothetical protein
MTDHDGKRDKDASQDTSGLSATSSKKGPELRKKKSRRKKKKKTNSSNGARPDQAKQPDGTPTTQSSGSTSKKSKRKPAPGQWPFKRGKPKHPALDTHFKVLTTEAARTHHEQMRRALWEYRDITSLLASNGHGQLIGLVTEMLVDKLKDAIGTARGTSEQMERAINKMMEAYGDEVEFSTRGMGEPHICTIVSSGPLSTQMMVYVREMDRAIVKLKLAYSAGLINYDRRRDGVIELIGVSRNIMLGARAMKKIVKTAVNAGVEDHSKWETLLEQQRVKLGLHATEQVPPEPNQTEQAKSNTETKPAKNPGKKDQQQSESGVAHQTTASPDKNTSAGEGADSTKPSVGGILRDLIQRKG